MKKSLTLFFVVLMGLIFTFASLSVSGGKEQGIKCLHSTVKAPDVKSSAVAKRGPEFRKIPLYFIPNRGQVNEKARFYAKTPRYTLWMTKEGLVFDSIRKGERDVSRLIFLGSNKKPGMVPIEMTRHKVNYFKGKDSSKWQKGIRTSKAVLYQNVYQDIDLKVYGIETQVEYDWIVKPGADPGNIRFKYQQVSKTHIDQDGNLVIETAFGEMMHKKPVSYQMIDGKRVPVKSEFRKTGGNTYGFKVEKYNRDYQLVIDPMVAITYSTYLGGSVDEEGFGIEVDSTGIYVIGYTNSPDFPTAGSCLNSYTANDDIFVTKFTPDGSGLIYSDIIGGSSRDRGTDLVVAANGHAFGTAYTYSNDLPANNSRAGKRDAVFFELDATGCLVCLWYMGGTENDSGTGIALDSSNNACIAVYTNSPDFPVTPGAYQNSLQGNYDVFILKRNCTDILFATYLGGSDKDIAYGVALDSSNDIYISGFTESSDLPVTVDAFQTVFGGESDAFVCKLEADGSDLVYCTYLGGSEVDNGAYIAVDGSGNAYITGETESDDFPVIDAIREIRAGQKDAFISKLNAAGSDLVYSTYYGGSLDNDGGWRLVLDASGAAYVMGYTGSENFPVKNAFQEELGGGGDVWMAKIDANGTHVVYATYLGGTGNEVLGEYKGDIALGSDGDVYVTSGTISDDFPVHNPYQCYPMGGKEVFVTRYSFSGCAPVLWVDKTLLNFGVNVDGDTTSTQRFIIRNIGGGELEWEITDNAAWLQCTPTTGRNFGVVEVSLDNVDGLAVGHHEAEITITAPNAADSPKTIYVTLWKHAANPQPGFNMPFGSFDNPEDGSTVYGSVPLSGWALDDIEVESVKLYYEDGPNLVYVSEATFVDGARPDVWQVYPDYPYSQRAGWGYVLLSNLYGNGSYNFHAIAEDKEGHQVTLGIKTLQISNSVYPFGNIDLPEPGGVASGSDYQVCGWALTPLPCSIDEVVVFVDGEELGEASYGFYRADIASLFPGYNDSNGAGFCIDFNTIGYRNGMHTVYARATDDCTHSSDFGHRYFNIWNIGSINSISQISSHPHHSMSEIAGIPIKHSEPVKIEKGYGKDFHPLLIPPDEKGQVFLEIKELERIKVQLNAASETGAYIGYQIVGNHLVRLPIGSTLDREKGIFYWQAGAGFIDLYQFVFIHERSGRERSKKFITVKIVPRFTE
jgi:hypothetical protein